MVVLIVTVKVLVVTLLRRITVAKKRETHGSAVAMKATRQTSAVAMKTTRQTSLVVVKRLMMSLRKNGRETW